MKLSVSKLKILTLISGIEVLIFGLAIHLGRDDSSIEILYFSLMLSLVSGLATYLGLPSQILIENGTLNLKFGSRNRIIMLSETSELRVLSGKMFLFHYAGRKIVLPCNDKMIGAMKLAGPATPGGVVRKSLLISAGVLWMFGMVGVLFFVNRSFPLLSFFSFFSFSKTLLVQLPSGHLIPLRERLK